MSYILGLNGRPFSQHDAAAALLDDRGRVLFHSEEERYSRTKHAVGQSPILASKAALDWAQIGPSDLDGIAVGWLPIGIGEHSAIRRIPEMIGVRRVSESTQVVFVDHHRAHALHAFHASGFNESAVLVVDGSGETASVSAYRADHDSIDLIWQHPVSRSLGYLYTALSRWLGLGDFGEGKAMGLTSYGESAEIVSVVRMAEAIPRSADHVDVLNYWQRRFEELTGLPRANTSPEELARDETAVRLACSVQAFVEAQIGEYANRVRSDSGLDNLCLTGGVAQNSVANGRVPDPVFVPSCPGDGGVALGAAYALRRPSDPQKLSPYLGTQVTIDDWEQVGIRFEPPDYHVMVQHLSDGQIGAVFCGRAEVGPRALCHRSLICRPDEPAIARRLNKVKGREPWRPFGPVSLRSSQRWETRDHLTDFMSGVVAVTNGGGLAGVQHVDGTVRPQVLNDPDEPVARLLKVFERMTGLRCLINTSFNIAGEPIVETPRQALASAEKVGARFLLTEFGYSELR